jgi:hypothetical protein
MLNLKYADDELRDTLCRGWSKERIFNNTEFHSLNKNNKQNNANFLVVVENFTEFTNMYCYRPINEYKNVRTLKLFANKRTLIEETVHFKNILSAFDISSFLYFKSEDLSTKTFTIEVQNVKGFNHDIDHTLPNHPNYQDTYMDFFTIQFIDINFDFYLNGSLITREMCVRENFQDRFDFLWPMRSIRFLHNIFYSKNVCPYVLLNSHVYVLSLFLISNSFIYKNQLEFLDIDIQHDESLLSLKDLVLLELNLIFENLTANF